MGHTTRSMKPLLPLLLLCGCATFSPVTIAREMGTIGWFQADEQLRWHPADKRRSCQEIAATVPEGEVIVLVHGVTGDGDEIRDLLPILSRSRPAAIFLYRWVAWDDRDAIARGFAVELSRLLECVPSVDGHLLVVGHSAGGIVVGFGSNLLVIPRRERTGPALYALTVASPLAGMTERAPNEGGRAEAKFMLDFGTQIAGYPIAPMAMAIAHLRTQYPGDSVMKPTATHTPNDPRIGVPGARQIDLPATLTHDAALVHVAEKIADGTWRAWFEEAARRSVP
jgi:pimeloyl-ACP methyl ester carboxylesterase